MRHNRKTAIVALLLALLMLLSGCWNRREPNQIAIMVSSLNDKTEDGYYSLTIEIFDPTPAEAKAGGGGGGGGGGGEGKSGVIIVNSVAETPPQAVLDETENLERKLYTAHTQARFMTEKVARGGVLSLMDYFIRNPESRQDPYLIVVRGENVHELYNCSTGLADTMASYIADMAQTQLSSTSEGVFVKTLDYLKADYLDGKDPVMGCAEVIEDPSMQQHKEGAAGSGGGSGGSGGDSGGDSSGKEQKKYVLRYKGLAAFRGGELRGYLDGTGTRAYNILTGQFKGALISLPEKQPNMEKKEYTLLSILKSQPKITVSLKDDKITVEAKVDMKLGLVQQAGKKDIRKEEVLREIIEEFKRLLEGQLSDAVKQAQEMGCDIFGFGVAMHAQHPEEWKKLKDKWTEYYSDAEFKPEIKAEIVKTGESKAPFELED